MKQRASVLLFFFLSLGLLAQNEPTITQLTVNDGLSQGMIFDILQTRDGFIWIATKDGLNRYDGSRFEVFSPNPYDPFAIVGSEVWDLFEDSRGWLWIGLPEGTDIYDPQSGAFFHIKHKNKSIPSFFITETADGAVWSANKHELIKIKLQNDQLQQALEQKSAYIEVAPKFISLKNQTGAPVDDVFVTRLHLTKEKKLLIGTNYGLFHLDTKTEKITPTLPFRGYKVNFISENRDGDLLIGTDKDFKHYWSLISKGKVIQKVSPLQNSFVAGQLLDDMGNVWLAQNNHLIKWKLLEFLADGKSEIDISPDRLNLDYNNGFGYICLMTDRSGLLWAGTAGFGIVKINEKGQKFKTSLPRTGHRLILEDKDGALYSAVLPDKKFTNKNFETSAANADFPIVEVNGRKALVYDRDGNLWWLADKLKRKDKNTKIISSFAFQGLALLYDRHDKLISVSEKGIHRFDPIAQKAQDFPFDHPQKIVSENSNYLYEDQTGVIWIFGLEGLIKAIPQKTGYHYVYYINSPKDQNSLSINTVMSVADDPLEPSHYLWVGTKGGGLNRLDKKTGIFRKFSQEHGLPDNVIYSILAEDKAQNGAASSYIWMSTNKGLCRFDVQKHTSKNFTVKDGLQDNEFNANGYLKTRDGHFIFCGINGINLFHPHRLHYNQTIPQVQITGLMVNNKRVKIDRLVPIELAADQNLLNFEFAALEFTNPSQNLYKYQLIGLDDKWVDLGYKNNIQFANLAPGHYTFRVRGSNNDGLWSQDAAELKFVINSPWYASWWAYLCYVLLLAFIIKSFYQYKINEKFKQQETNQLREMDEFKSRFFTNITHEFRTPLTVILGVSDQLAKEQKDQNQAKKIELIKRNGDNLLRLVNQILDLSKLESQTLQLNYTQGDVLAYLKYITESLHSVANAQNLLLKVESDHTSLLMDYDPVRLLQIIYNLLSNAIKFTPSGGKITLKANEVGNNLHLSVADTGAGIAEDELNQLFDRFFQAKNQQHAKTSGTGIGLSLTRELVRLMGGEISVESKKGLGTQFNIVLPITRLAPKENDLSYPDTSLSQPSNPITPVENYLHQNKYPASSTILLIEDNADVVEYLTACLQNEFQLDFAFNGQAGIEKALETQPDLIISDVMMPIKDGFEVLGLLKSDEKTSHIPIILLTARADIQSRLAGLRKGADAYLAKPFNPEELIATIQNLLETRKKLQLKYQQLVIVAPPINDVKAEVEDMEDLFIQKFKAVVNENVSNSNFEMPDLEKALAMSRSQIYRKIKALTDKSPSQLIRSIRLQQGRHLLLTTQLTVSEIAYEVGYTAINNFSDAYLEEFGERPLKTRG